jgi:PAS domain S-box-containing protein
MNVKRSATVGSERGRPGPDAAEEARRLAALHELGVLDSLPEPVFDAIAASAAQVCGVPIALISLIDGHRQWFKSNVGLSGLEEIPRNIAFCDHAIRDTTLLEVADARLDARFADNPLVTGHPDIRFYAGAPIVMAGGERVGTVCVADRRPRRLDDRQRATLESLARIVGAALTQRRRLLSATGQLAASEQRVRRLYESTPAILHSIDADGRILDVSDRWLALLGYQRHEVVGRLSSDFLAPASKAYARDVVLPEFFRTGRCDRIEYQFVRRDGVAIDVLLSATLEGDAQGGGGRSLAVLEDATATRQLTAELDRTHAHLDAVVDNMPALVGYWDRDGVTRLANRDFQAAVGLPIDRLLGRPLREIFGAVDALGYEVIAPRVDAVLEGRRQEFECAMLTTSGLRQLRVTLVPAQPVEGRVDGFYGTWFDITGMKALELRQRDSEQRYRLLFDHLPSAHALQAIEVDTTGKPVDYRFLAMNPAFSAMLALDPVQAIGSRATDVFPGIATDPADWIGKFGRVALSGEPVRFDQPAASGRWWDVVAYRPAPGQFAVIAQEISERKRLESEVAAGALREQALERRLAGNPPRH